MAGHYSVAMMSFMITSIPIQALACGGRRTIVVAVDVNIFPREVKLSDWLVLSLPFGSDQSHYRYFLSMIIASKCLLRFISVKLLMTGFRRHRRDNAVIDVGCLLLFRIPVYAFSSMFLKAVVIAYLRDCLVIIHVCVAACSNAITSVRANYQNYCRVASSVSVLRSRIHLRSAGVDF